MSRLFLGSCALGLTLAFARPVQAWELFRSESGAVERGNAALAKGQHKEALEAYDEAARELPDDPGVQLDRGLALLGVGKLGEAREAFRRAASGSAPKELRGAALYNMGLGFVKEAEQAATAEDLDGAKKLLEESVDALKGSLRAQPRNHDAAWNLEIAKRRLVDVQKKQEEKKKQDEEKKKDQEKDKQDKQDKQDQGDKDQNEQDPQKQQGDAGTPDKPDPRMGDAGTPEDDGGAQADPDEGGEQPDAGAPKPKPEQGDAAAPAPQPSPQPADNDVLPEHMERALDALEAGEENLEKQRARQRARARPRRVEKDW
jgi:Ca-activated chloride channel family protein